jgi:DNA-binding response OmpR family regulator
MTWIAESDALAGRRVLVVEDEWIVAVELDDELTQMGCRVIGPVPSVSDAMEILVGESIDIALVDIGLGDDTGYPIAQALGARNVPVVFLTGYHMTALAPEFRHLRCLEKPAGARGLAIALAGALADANTGPADG